MNSPHPRVSRITRKVRPSTMYDANIDNIVFALLFSADEPLSIRKMSGMLPDFQAAEIKAAVDRWKTRIDDEAWSIKIEKVAGGYQLASRPEYAPFIAKLYSGKRKLRLSKAALEALAVIAYKQPITRADVENVRGVNCGGVISNLLERGLIKITGKAKVLGSPFLYNTTQEFLEYLGLDSLKDLPSIEELEALLEREENARRDSEDESQPASLPDDVDLPEETLETPEETPGAQDETFVEPGQTESGEAAWEPEPARRTAPAAENEPSSLEYGEPNGE